MAIVKWFGVAAGAIAKQLAVEFVGWVEKIACLGMVRWFAVAI